MERRWRLAASGFGLNFLHKFNGVSQQRSKMDRPPFTHAVCAMWRTSGKHLQQQRVTAVETQTGPACHARKLISDGATGQRGEHVATGDQRRLRRHGDGGSRADGANASQADCESIYSAAVLKSLRFMNSRFHPRKKGPRPLIYGPGTAGWDPLWWKVSGPSFLHLNGADIKRQRRFGRLGLK